ncbi:MAG: leucine-rich repeat protein, partial [Clostridia bacterium]|nr:leucine-rich repeat protein [Clostridia bacterium]
MGKVFRSIIIAIMIMVCSFGFVACGETPPPEFTIRFIVNDEEYHTLSTSGNTVIKMPEDPTMEEYDFVGWYWDKYIWEKPFTVNSLLHTPLSSNMEVHARFVLKHNHNLEHKEYKPASCGEFGNEEYWQCATCSKMYDDAYGIREIFNIPTLSKLGHIKGEWEIAVPATCEETGLRHKCCVNCGAALEVEVLATTGHAYTNWITTVEPTYTTMGTAIRGCEHCSYSETKDIPMLTVIASKPTNLVVDHGVLRWEGESTFGFEVIVNGESFTTEDNFFEPELINEDYNTVQVAAIGLNDTRSEYVELANFVVNQPISNLHFTDNGQMVTFTWDSPSNLYDYTVVINGIETTVAKDTKTYSIASNTCSVGDEISIYVQGVANANFYPSKKQTITLNAIDAPVVSISGLNVVWEAVTNASSYKVVGDTTFVPASGVYAFGCEGLASGVHTLAVSAFGVDYLSSTTTFTFNKLVAPAVSISGDTLSWPAVAGQIKYTVIDDGQEHSITGQSYTLSSATADFDVYLYAASMQPNTMQSDSVVVSKFSCDEYSTYYYGTIVQGVVCYTDIAGDVLYVPNSIMHEVDFSGITKNVTLVASRVPYTLDKNVVTSIIVPSNITAIPMAAFENCVNATSATISSSVTTINKNIFAGCTALASVTIPYVGDGADNAFFGYIFGATNYSNQYDAIPSTLKTVTITGGTSIADNAFYDCEYIESVSLPEGLETIGSEVFQDCFALSTINIPSTITNIGSSAFNCCINMSRVNITNLNAWFNISFEDVSSNPLLDGKLYLNGTLIENLVIPKEITCIKNYAFNSASQLKSVTFEEGSSCTTIGVESFGWCINLESITLPNSLTTIGSVAFGSCNKLTTIVIPNSVTSIGYGAFDDCNALQSITLPFTGDGTSVNTNFGYIFAETDE